MLRNIEQYGQSATRFPARPGHMEGTSQLRGWVGELRRTVGSLRDQTASASGDGDVEL